MTKEIGKMQFDKIREADIEAVITMAAELSAHGGMPPPNLTYAKVYDIPFGQSAFVD